MKISIIVPVLNEAPILGSFLAHVREHAPSAEMIICDGDSTDATWELAPILETEHCCRVVKSPRGRASQMNAGARIATGEILWFLHVDSQLPAGCMGMIHEALADPSVAGGCFSLRMPDPRLLFRISDSLGNLAVDLFRIALGDHGIFCRHKVFEQVGGYPEIPLMEDARFYEAMQRHGRVRQLRATITTSTRAYEKYGPARTTLYYFVILALYVARTPISIQHRVYRHLTSRSRATHNAPAPSAFSRETL